MNEWSPPAGATPQQYTGGKDPDGSVQLADAIAKMRAVLSDLPHHLLEQAGIRVEQDLVRFVGAVDITSTTHIGGTLDVDADATFGGAMAITGTLSLPAGIIDNDALTSPIVYASNNSVNVGTAVTTTRTNKATATVAVTAGFTKAQVWAFSDAMAVNRTAADDYLYVGTTINTYEGGENYVDCRIDAGNSVSHTAVTALAGLTGGDLINCTVTSRTSEAAWAANVGNLWRIQVVVIFSR